MKFSTQIKKAMIDKGISSASELATQSGVSYYIVLRLLKNDGTCRLNDLNTIVKFLNTKVTFE